jgi:hypothetical protein
VDAHASGLIQPLPGWPHKVVGILVVEHPGPEVPLGVAHTAIDLALGLGPPGLAQPGLETGAARTRAIPGETPGRRGRRHASTPSWLDGYREYLLERMLGPDKVTNAAVLFDEVRQRGSSP